MSTVPAAAAAAFCAADPDAAAVCGRHLVRIGERVEVHLGRLAREDPTLARALAGWWHQTQALWRAARTGAVAGRGWARTRRRLVAQRQSVDRGAKSDLVGCYEALTTVPALAPAVLAATAVRPVAAQVRALAGAVGGSFRYAPEDYRGALVLPMAGSLLWPAALGGNSHPTEVARTVRLDLRYAAWRDRRVRRIAAVEVDIEELWAPLPTGAAGAQPLSPCEGGTGHAQTTPDIRRLRPRRLPAAGR